ncbi:MAG: hypothetical protein RIS36_1335 [Pseudomonadota bacterium]
MSRVGSRQVYERSGEPYLGRSYREVFVNVLTHGPPSRVVKNGSVVSILRVLTKRGGDDEKTGGVSTEIR